MHSTHRVTLSAALAGALLFLGSAGWADSDADIPATHFGASSGDPESDVTYVYLQGGPIPFPLADFVGEGGFPALGGPEAFYVIPHQVQTRDPARFMEEALTMESAREAAAESTVMAGEVIEYLIAQGKTVRVIGESYGSFVALDTIAEFGNIADEYLIIVGRVDMPDNVWQSFADGVPMAFEMDGVTQRSATIEEAGMGAGTVLGDQNMIRLAAGLGYHRYSELLAKTDLSNVVYITALKDQQVGVLTDEEVRFLEGQGATVVVADSSHEEAMTSDDGMPWLRRLFEVEE